MKYLNIPNHPPHPVTYSNDFRNDKSNRICRIYHRSEKAWMRTLWQNPSIMVSFWRKLLLLRNRVLSIDRSWGFCTPLKTYVNSVIRSTHHLWMRLNHKHRFTATAFGVLIMDTKFKFQKLKHLMWPRCMSVVGWLSLNWNSSIFAFPHCNIKWLKSKFQSEYHKNPFTLRNAFIFIHNFDWIRHWTGMWEHLFWNCVKMKMKTNKNSNAIFFTTFRIGGYESKTSNHTHLPSA